MGLLLLLVWLSGCAGPSAQMAPVVRPGGGDYIVKKGDNLYGIAFQRGVRMQDVVTWNRISNPDLIHPGQRLRMSPPDTGRAAVPVVHKRPVATKPVVVASVPPPEPVVSKPGPTAPLVVAPVLKPASKAGVQAVKRRPRSKPAEAPHVASASHDGLRWSWPTKGKVFKGFQASSEGKRGIDIAGSAGQTIVAAASGKIVYSGSGLRGYGQLIIIEHNKKYLSAYAHNSVLRAKEGDRVARGQPIAKMGKSGTSRVMLHFEIRRDGKAVDPARYLPAPNP